MGEQLIADFTVGSFYTDLEPVRIPLSIVGICLPPIVGLCLPGIAGRMFTTHSRTYVYQASPDVCLPLSAMAF